jgi:hypothetical protein
MSAMSFDSIVSLALFFGALFLMMRFGCGAHLGHAHRHGAPAAHQTGGTSRSNPGKAVGAGVASPNSVTSALSLNGGQPGKALEDKPHRHGCC